MGAGGRAGFKLGVGLLEAGGGRSQRDLQQARREEKRRDAVLVILSDPFGGSCDRGADGSSRQGRDDSLDTRVAGGGLE